ncbi:dihydrofolate reductase family protein [Agrococcus baldri]|uniref:Dihydrofolate reductase n=1 Tax=Agrococcus baldri TaxID=153730 RepID=A0AA87REI3_9MICO|nr:dihydrofolate reductase family protein [Agrococcus baldri]GEK81231.1 dihydrofolate reductase [Agrococcus baldri]
MSTGQRTLAITQNITLDGSIEMLGDWFDPMDQTGDLLEVISEHTARESALLLGRRTFEDFRGFWPEQTDDETGISAQLNAVPKYVVSSTMTDPGWQHTTVLSGDWLGRVRELKDEPGDDIIVTGSITLCHALIEARVVDELRLFVYPVVQGSGRRLFPEEFQAERLRLTESRGFTNGVSLLQYAF